MNSNIKINTLKDQSTNKDKTITRINQNLKELENKNLQNNLEKSRLIEEKGIISNEKKNVIRQNISWLKRLF